MSLKRRIFTKDFKLQVIRQFGGNKWQKLHTQYAQNAFQGNGHTYTEDAKMA